MYLWGSTTSFGSKLTQTVGQGSNVANHTSQVLGIHGQWTFSHTASKLEYMAQWFLTDTTFQKNNLELGFTKK